MIDDFYLDDESEELRSEAEDNIDVNPLLSITLFSQYLQRHSEDSESWYNMGTQYTKVAHDDKAMECYEEALKYLPKENEINEINSYICELISCIHYNRGNIYSRQDKIRYAIECYKLANYWLPSDDAYEQLAVCYANINMKLTAIGIYRVVTQCN